MIKALILHENETIHCSKYKWEMASKFPNSQTLTPF